MDEVMTPFKKRQEEIATWINIFVTKYNIDKKYDSNRKAVSIDDAAEILNSVYWHLLETYVRDIVEGVKEKADGDKINRFKIISVLEFSIISVLPIVFDGSVRDFEMDEEEVIRKLNADFAWYCSIQILLSWFRDTGIEIVENKFLFVIDYKDHLIEDQNKVFSIKEEHLNLMTYINREASFPIFSNAHFWRMLEFSLLFNK